jgi:hypothetical protein
MKIPRYWRKASATATRPDGTAVALRAWGWSVTDAEEAEREARERLGRMVDRVSRGEALPDRYPYGVRALREEIVAQIETGDGETPVIVTRNGYGSLVINAPSVMFVDIDVEDPGLMARLGSLFQGKRRSDAGLEALKASVASASSSTFRIYRTAGGYRLIATERTFEPGSREAENVMEAVGADPAYVRLCRAQRSFRARVTPKPWRCGQRLPPNDFPRDPTEQAAFLDWLDGYQQACASLAVCRYVGEVGAGRVAAQVAPILRYHDDHTRARQDLSLA